MKKTILYRNSGVFPLGIPISHSWMELGGLLALIEEYKVSLFIELGVHAGGLAAMLVYRTEYRWEPNPGFSYLGIENKIEDIHPQLVKDVVGMQGAEIWYSDVFSNSVGLMVEQRIKEHDGKAMVYCDNGDKPSELAAYKDLLRHGDIIAVHDFPKEIRREDFKDFTDLKRLQPEYLDDTRIVVFQKRGASS